MVKTGKNILITLILAAVLLVSGVAVAFAYFGRSSESDGSITLDTSAETITVSSFDELFAAAKAESYLPNDPVSDAGTYSRKTILLSSNVSMSSDIEITADVSLDLGGFDLITNGYSLTFRHSYYGSIVVRNGRLIVTANGGYVYADTPNAAVYFDGVTAGTTENDMFTESSDERLVTISSAPYFTAYNFFKTVAAAIADETVVLTERKNFGETTDSAFVATDFYDGTATKCASHGACVYAAQDLDLPFSYYGFGGAVIGYSFANGKFTEGGGIGGTYGDEVLTAKITINGSEYSCDFPIHVPDLSSEQSRVNAVATMFTRYLNSFWVETSEDADGNEISVKKYVINRDAYLPVRFFGLDDVSVTVEAFDENGEKTFPSDDSVSDGDVVYFVPTAASVKLTATVSENGTSVTKEYDMTSSNTVTVRSAVTVASNLLGRWYGTEITVIANDDGTYSYSGATDEAFSSYMPLYDINHYLTADSGAFAAIYPGIKSITYSVVYGNTAEEFYAISEAQNGENHQRLEVVEGNPENDAGRVYLNVELSVEFGGKTSDVTIQIPIRCTLKGDESGLGRFLPYYSVFDRTAQDATGGYTTSDFRMPFNYQRDLPLVCYGFAVKNDDETLLDTVSSALGLTFTDLGGTSHILAATTKTETFDDGTSVTYLSFSDALNALYPTPAALKTQVQSGKAYFTITIDPDGIPLDNTDILLVYEFKTGFTATKWSVYSSFSEFVLAGIVKYGTHVTDPNFYVWLYNSTSDSGETISSPADGLVYSDKLKRNVTLDYENSTDSYLLAVTDFTGIGYMVGTQKINLSGATVSNAVIEEIAYLSSLVSLDLSGCSITVTADETSPFTVWGDPNASRLTNLTVLHLETNAIYSFDWLTPLCSSVARSLTRIYLSGNVPDANASNSADNVFYGSDGLNNYGTYLELTSAGITVYSGGAEDSPAVFADSRSSSPVYLAMRNLTYQNKLPAGVTVSDLINSFSTDYTDYGLDLTAKNTTYSCSVNSIRLYFTAHDDYFTFTYEATTSNGSTYTVTLKYSVTTA